MKRGKLLSGLLFLTTALCVGASAFAGDGLRDSHGVWRDADYWHANHPEWVYRYHPEWAVERREWWLADHGRHPEWFYSPYWRRYPVWTYGAYDRGHVWRDAGWWRERDAGWFYAHHPEWAEPYPRWIREDHGRHPEWFRSAYWGEHPRDWNHPDAEFRRELDRNVEYQHSHPAGPANAYGHENHEGYHAGGMSAENRNVAAGQYHPPATNQYHASASSSSHGGGGGGGGGGGHHGKH